MGGVSLSKGGKERGEARVEVEGKDVGREYERMNRWNCIESGGRGGKGKGGRPG